VVEGSDSVVTQITENNISQLDSIDPAVSEIFSDAVFVTGSQIKKYACDVKVAFPTREMQTWREPNAPNRGRGKLLFARNCSSKINLYECGSKVHKHVTSSTQIAESKCQAQSMNEFPSI
jgi:hypothetical protein